MATDERAILREIIEAWDETRARWIARFGNDEGFSEWFTRQIAGEPDEHEKSRARAVDMQERRNAGKGIAALFTD